MMPAHTKMAMTLLASALLLGACDEGNTVEGALPGNVDVDIDDDGAGSLSVDSSGGSFDMAFGGEIPDGFPDDIALVDGEILSATRMEDDDEDQVIYSVVIEVADGDADAIADQARQSMLDAGFEITRESDQTVGERRVIEYELKGHGYIGNVSILEGDGLVTVGYTFGEPGS